MKSFLIFFSVIFFAVATLGAQSTTFKSTATLKSTVKTTLKGNVTNKTSLKPTTTVKANSVTTLKPNPITVTTKPQTRTTSTTQPPLTTTAPMSNLYNVCDDNSSSELTGRIQAKVANFTWDVSHYGCFFEITAKLGYVIQFTCSNLTNLTRYPDDYLEIQGTLDAYFFTPEINRVYYTSSSGSTITVFHVPFGYPRVTSWFDCSWETIPYTEPTTQEFLLCHHEQAYAANGTVQYLEGDMGPPRVCLMHISDVFTRKVPIFKISCSTTNSTSDENAMNYLSLSPIKYNFSDINAPYLSCVQPLSNQVYYGYGGFYVSARVGNGWGFQCNWTSVDAFPTSPTTPQLNTFRFCLDTNSTATNGTIKMFANVTASHSIGCQFAIQAPPNQRIQLSCIVVTNIALQIKGAVGTYTKVAHNMVYTSIGNRIELISVNATPNYSLWGSSTDSRILIDCKWTAIAATPPDAEFKLCQDSQTSMTSGTIRSLEREPGLCTDFDWLSIVDSSEEKRYCSFLIIAPADYRVQMSCSVADNAYVNGMLIQGTLDSNSSFPIQNRVYTSLSNKINVTSATREPNWIQCSWTMIPNRTTNDFKLCRDREARTTNGTIQPLDGETKEERWCDFSIIAPLGHQIQFICPVMNITSVYYNDGSSQTSKDIVKNTTVISTLSVLNISTYIYNFGWIDCKWKMLPPTLYKVCRDRTVEAANSGVIQPLNTLQGPQMCLFTISVPSGQRVQMSCSDVKLVGITSLLEFTDELKSVLAYEPIVNRTYTSTGNRMFITTVVNATDWFNCQWLAV